MSYCETAWCLSVSLDQGRSEYESCVPNLYFILMWYSSIVLYCFSSQYTKKINTHYFIILTGSDCNKSCCHKKVIKMFFPPRLNLLYKIFFFELATIYLNSFQLWAAHPFTLWIGLCGRIVSINSSLRHRPYLVCMPSSLSVLHYCVNTVYTKNLLIYCIRMQYGFGT